MRIIAKLTSCKPKCIASEYFDRLHPTGQVLDSAMWKIDGGEFNNLFLMSNGGLYMKWFYTDLLGNRVTMFARRIYESSR